jgi:glutamate-1-semialdehyde 2,1-aminomutase
MQTRPKTMELLKKLRETLPGGVNSPVRAFSGLGIPPLVIDYGKADEITDLDGNTYIDYNMAWGSLILGHAHPEVIKKTKAQIDKGSSFGMTTQIEYEWAKELHSCVPSLEKSRVVASGTEATMTAVRLARAYTSRNFIVKFNGNYHGHSDAFLVKAGSGVAHHYQDSSSRGVPKEVVHYSISLPFNDMSAFKSCMEKQGHEIAAVIIEPIAGNMGVVPATAEFIELVRAQTKCCGALLIFDEVITGFRIGLGGAQAFYQVTPELSTFSKIIGGGYPIGAVGGKKEIMDLLAPIGPVYQAGTLSGNPVALYGALAVLEQLKTPGFYEELQKSMDQFITPIEEALVESGLPACLNRAGTMFSVFWGVRNVSSFEDVVGVDREMFNKFFSFLLEKGIYFSPSPFEANFLSAVHTKQHLQYTQDAILEFIHHIKAAVAAGEVPAYAPI